MTSEVILATDWDQTLDLPGDEPGRLASGVASQIALLKVADWMRNFDREQSRNAGLWTAAWLDCLLERRPLSLVRP